MSGVDSQSSPKTIYEKVISGTVKEPTVFDGFIKHWGASCWSPSMLACSEELAHTKLIYRRSQIPRDKETEPETKVPKTDIEWENLSEYITCTFQEFLQYANDCSTGQPHWLYADYKHMKDIFHENPQMLKGVDWGVFGFSERDGSSSTFWMGTAGAHTPCHYDTYGCNLVAQIYGRKKWVLFPPSETANLYPTRIPFEESSVFSRVDVRKPDHCTFPLFANAVRYEVVLEPGQVLFVPKHWWHFVECESTAISINTWIELASDRDDQVTENLSAMLAKSLLDYAGPSAEQTVYNPKETPLEYEEGIKILNHLLSTSPEMSDCSQSREFQQCTCCDRKITPVKLVQPDTTLGKGSLLTSKTENPSSQTHSEQFHQLTFSDIVDCIVHPDVLRCIRNVIDTRHSISNL